MNFSEIRDEEKNGSKQYENKYNDEISSDETLNTSLDDDCSPCAQQAGKKRGRRCGWSKFCARCTAVEKEIEKSDKCLSRKCCGKRLRKRISRGVQTESVEKLLPRTKRRIGNLFKVKWPYGKKRGKHSSVPIRGEITQRKNSVEVIYKPPRPGGNYSRRKNTKTVPQDSNSNDETITSVSSNEESKTREKLSQTNKGDNYALNKNYNRKYDFTIDGTNVEVIRNERSNGDEVEKGSKSPRKFADIRDVDSREKRANADGRKRRRKCKGNAVAGKSIERNSTVSADEGSSGNSSQIYKRKSDKSKGHGEAVERKNVNVVDKVKSMEDNRPKKLKTTKHTRGKINKSVTGTTEKPAVAKENSSNLKTFTNKVKKSFTLRRPLNGESSSDVGIEPIGKQLNARRNDIADVKKRLDACITDLNNIILDLSKVFEQTPDPGGLAGEGTTPENINLPRPGRSRFR